MTTILPSDMKRYHHYSLRFVMTKNNNNNNNKDGIFFHCVYMQRKSPFSIMRRTDRTRHLRRWFHIEGRWQEQRHREMTVEPSMTFKWFSSLISKRWLQRRCWRMKSSKQWMWKRQWTQNYYFFSHLHVVSVLNLLWHKLSPNILRTWVKVREKKEDEQQ